MSVVVTCTRDRRYLQPALRALCTFCRDRGVELVVARPESESGLKDLEAAFPEARFVIAAETAPSALRVAGMAVVHGDIVAIIDDTMKVDYGKISHLLRRQTGQGATLEQTRIEAEQLGREWATAFTRHGISLIANGVHNALAGRGGAEIVNLDATIPAPRPPLPSVRHEAPSVTAVTVSRQPSSWRMSTRAIAWRLFLTCWVVYGLHFATDIVREHYPAIALGDHFSFRLDEYAGLHPDLFEKPGYGWHIGNNPGVSILAAMPYLLARPVIDPVVAVVKARRAASGVTEPPDFTTPRPNAKKFFAESWRRGLDVKLGLAALVMHALLMAPSSALGVVFVFFALRAVFGSDRTALWLSLLYAFGTPVFFRTGFLNHNLMLGHIAFMGFWTMWNPLRSARYSSERRYLLGGVTGGTALLFDYSGVIFLMGLFVYGALKRWRETSARDAVRHSIRYVLGTIGPVLILWLYQWRSFGNLFLPGQHWMPPVRWIELGYQGYSGPQLDLLYALAFDHRFGLFMAAPILLLALASPLVNRRERRVLPGPEEILCLILFVGLWVFFSGSNYTRLQWNTGVRYMTPILPFIFLPAAVVLVRMSMRAIYAISVFSVVLAWCMAMNREVWRPLGVLEPVARVFVGGFELPALTTLSRMPGIFGEYVGNGVSPLPLFVLAAIVIYLIWTGRLASATPDPLPR